MKAASLIICAGVALMFVSGCGSSRRGVGFRYESGDKQTERIVADAYRFNARLRRNGKPTTFKLDFYVTDTLVGIGGRGYLGKGALKGYMTADSIKLFFPATDEYLDEPTPNLLASIECVGKLPDLNWLDFFQGLPDSIGLSTEFVIDADYKDDSRPRFAISHPGCQWQLGLVYDRVKGGWRIKRISFDDGKQTRLSAKRDEFRSGARVKQTRFEFHPKPSSIRIIL